MAHPQVRPGGGPAELASALLERLPELAAQLADRIVESVPVYRDDTLVPLDDLRESCRDNLEFMLRSLSDNRTHDLAAPRRTGERRAEQGAPLVALHSAFRILFSFFWDVVVSEGRRSGRLSDTDLVDVASQVWHLHETFTTAMATAYRDAQTVRLLKRDQERSALVEALLAGRASDVRTVWEAADLLGLPYQGVFVVVAAEVPELARQALPGVEDRLRGRGIGSGWRLSPDLHVGIVSLRTAAGVERAVDVLRPLAIARVGVSPPYGALEDTPAALHLARLALEGVRPGTAGIAVFDEAPLQALVVSSPTTSYRMTEKVLGPLLALAPAEREMLLATLQAYFGTGGSVAEAGKLLFCHPNTVRNHLRRIERHTGKSLDDPAQSAELYVALAAFTRLPERPAPGSPG
jgi:DNA-directed RNA polymerase specialized sigma24 family protein